MRTTYKFCLLLLMNTISVQLSAQRIEWSKTFGGNGYDPGFSVTQTHDGGYILAGSTGSFGAGESDCYIIRTDKDGNEIWSNVYGGIGADECYSIFQSDDRGFIATGRSMSFGNGLDDYWVLKYDENGNIIWSNTWGGTDSDVGIKMALTKDGGFIVIGWTIFESGGSWDLGLVKFNSEGNVEWYKIIDANDDSTYSGHDFGYDVQQTEDEGYIIVGSTDTDTGFTDAWIVKTDFEGNVQWNKTYGYSYNEETYSVDQTIDNGYIIVGKSGSFVNYDGDLWILKIDENGNQVWDKTYTSGSSSEGRSVQQTMDGGFIIVGWNRLPGKGNDFWILKTNVEGDTLWTRSYGGSGFDSGYDIEQTPDQGFIVTGDTRSYGNGGSDIWLIKMSVAPIPIIDGETIWLDSNYDGFAEGTISAERSHSLRAKIIVLYEWIVDGVYFSNEDQTSLNLATGTHSIKLRVHDEMGAVDSLTKFVHIHSQEIQTGGPISSAISSIGDSLFFASSTDDKIYHFDKDGDIRWSLIVGGDIQSTTTVGPNDRIYVGSSDTRLYAFNLNGNFDWDLSMGGVITASPAVTYDDILYVGINTGRLFSINGVDGSINWNYLTGGPITSSASISDSGIVYFGSDDSKLYALNTDGTLKWSYTTGGAVQSSPALDTLGNVYFGSDDGSIYALNSSGTELWSYTTGGEVNSSPVIGADGTVYFGSADSNVYAVSSTGQLVWSYRSDSPVNGTGALSFNEILYIGTDNGKLLALSSTGELLWHYQTDGAITAPPLITVDNMIYVGSSDGAIYGMVDPNLLGLSKKTITKNSGQWPTFQQNNQRTGQRSGDVFGPVLTVALLANPIIGSYYDLYLFSDEALQATPSVTLNDVAVEMTLESQVGDYVYHRSVHVTQSGMNVITITALDLVGNETTFESSFTFGKLAFNSDNRIVHNELGITFMVPGKHLMTEGNLLLSSIDLTENLNQLKKLYPSLNFTTIQSDGEVFVIETNALLIEDFKLSSGIKENDIRTFQRLTPSGWEQLESYTDESRSTVWAYSSEPGIYGIFEGGELTIVPTEFNLSDAFPNPFNLSTTIRYVVPVEGDFKESHSSRVNLNIYNIRGQLVKRVVNREQNPGVYEVSWNGTNESGRVIATGIYLMRLSVGDNISTKKLTVLK
ncbi:T9SS type A sorting domain-containing protein [Candidatus Marinimicrobia bacterium MT.SAG.3]|nr:T9SS type A sorting domain-containing protein [Candidatus Marinimicrobia bacterium MT.SAG.3]